MACIKRQLRTLPLLVSAILLLCTANAIRSFTTEKDHILSVSDILTGKATGHRVPMGGLKMEQHIAQGREAHDFEETCNSVDEEEECLMRRTLAAHVDYIYTGQHSP